MHLQATVIYGDAGMVGLSGLQQGVFEHPIFIERIIQEIFIDAFGFADAAERPAEFYIKKPLAARCISKEVVGIEVRLVIDDLRFQMSGKLSEAFERLLNIVYQAVTEFAEQSPLPTTRRPRYQIQCLIEKGTVIKGEPFFAGELNTGEKVAEMA